MVEPVKNRMRDDVAEPLDRACAWRVLPKRNVSSHFVIIGGMFRKDSSKVLCVEHDCSPVSNIGDIWGLEEGADESSIILDTDEVGFDALLQDFV